MKEKENYKNLLVIRTNTKGLQYDINAMIKSFFPAKEVRVLEPDETVHDEKILDIPSYMDIEINENEGTIKVFGENPNTFSFDTNPEIGSKNSFKLFFYDVMCEITGKSLPWGNLTGIRPTKKALTMLQEGADDAGIRNLFIGHHKVSEEKTNLAISIAHREKNLLDKLDYEHGYSLYIGIPFCPTTCLYCSFTSFPIAAWQNRLDDYINALSKEIDYVAKEHSGAHPDTVYIGGGTPTSLDEYHLEQLLCKLTSTIDISKSLEFTLEAGRPDSITPEKLAIMKKYGVTRISVNPQTMQQKTLDLIGRRVNTEQIVSTFYAAREQGFDDINMDIILGLPGEGIEEVSDTLEKICNMGPDSLTVHSLAIKRASALKRRLDEIGIEALNNTDETMALAAAAAKSMDMSPYYLYRQKNMSGNFENVGYAKKEISDAAGNIISKGKEGIYNILIMEEVQSIVALGAGTVTKRVIPGDGGMNPGDGVSGSSRIERCDNVKDVGLYIEKIDDMIERKRKLFSY